MKKLIITITLVFLAITHYGFAKDTIECKATTTFKNNEWRLITLPCDPQGKTVRDLFGNAGFGKIYTKDWVINKYNASNQTYKKISLDDIMEVGKGYSFIQNSGKDIPYTLTGTTLNKNRPINIESNGQETWNLIGFPYPYTVKSIESKWYSEANNTALTWAEANTQKLIHSEIYLYKDGKYIKKNMSNTEATIDPWDAFWVKTAVNYSDMPLYVSLDNTIHAPYGNTNEWELVPKLSDEFNGIELNTTKWDNHDPKWLGRKPAYFIPSNISVKDGKLLMVSRIGEEKDNLPDGYTIAGSAIKSKTLPLKYGYFETRCKLTRTVMTSAFWLYKSTKKAYTEIDIIEAGLGSMGLENELTFAHHVFKDIDQNITEYDAKEYHYIAPFDAANEFHTYAVDWNESTITWLIDNVVIWTQPNTWAKYPLDMMFSNETQDSRGVPAPESLPSVMEVDYVRVWQKKPNYKIASPLKSLFYQPLLKDANLTHNIDWNYVFSEMKNSKIDTLILQWSKLGGLHWENGITQYDFTERKVQDQENNSTTTWLKEILTKAKQHHIKVVIGLYSDEEFFKKTEKTTNETQEMIDTLKSYFSTFKNEHMTQMYRILKYTQKENLIFDGWYIPHEYDNVNFYDINGKRQTITKEHLSTLSKKIKQISSLPLFISAFFNSKNHNRLDAKDYAETLSHIIGNQYTLFLHSGLGTTNTDLDGMVNYIQAFKSYYQGKVVPLLEGFNPSSEAMNLDNFSHQIDILMEVSKESEFSLFSFRYFFYFNAKLLKYYQGKYIHQ